ncbi:MAG: hypothetical protein HOI35_13755 [Woeseia sp.]|nr:hypothetical protein [Woeseia sp.]
MFDWFGRLFGGRSAVEERRQNPVLAAAVELSALVYNRIPLHKMIDEARRAELARALYLEVNELCNSRDPVIDCRERFVAVMLELAAFQVLVIPPSPEDDPFELRQQPGITGELQSHLRSLFDSNHGLRSALFAVEDTSNEMSLTDFVLRQYWELYWRLETLNAARIALGDVAPENDWKQAFLHAASVNCEHLYRWELQLPAAFDHSIANEASTAYSMFTDIVVSGAKDPAAEWREYYSNSDIPMPDFRV